MPKAKKPFNLKQEPTDEKPSLLNLIKSELPSKVKVEPKFEATQSRASTLQSEPQKSEPKSLLGKRNRKDKKAVVKFLDQEASEGDESDAPAVPKEEIIK